MKRRVIFFSFSIIVIFSLVAGLTASTAQTNLQTGGESQVLYFADTTDLNAPHETDWMQVNIDGFGNPSSDVYTLEVFDGQLYAGTADWTLGTRVWRTSNGTDWTAVSEPGFGSPLVNSASTAQIWRSPDGTTWEQVVGDGFGDPANVAIGAFTVFSDTLYAVAQYTGKGLAIWSSPSGDPLSWTRVVDNGWGDPTNSSISGFATFDGYLYAAIFPSAGHACKVWRSANGTDWEPVITDGFGDPNNTQMGGWAILKGFLYIGTQNNSTGAQLWGTSNGIDWDPFITDGFGDLHNVKIESLFTFEDYLFAATQNSVTGMEVWRSPDGLSWSQINTDGFGDRYNVATFCSSGTTEFKDHYYIGTGSWGNGGEIWRYQPEVFASFTATPTEGIAPLEVTFTNTTTATLTANLWSFGDGLTSTLTSPTHTFSIVGAYTVTLVAESFGNTDTITKTNFITVYAPVSADFSANPTTGPLPLTVAFTNLSTGDFDTCLWDFGDTYTSTLCSPPDHVYLATGVYTVTLTTSGLGGSDIETKSGYITVEMQKFFLPVVTR
jgi:PKD repeat protein